MRSRVTLLLSASVILLFAASSLLSQGSNRSRIAGVIAEGDIAALPGSAHPLARPEFDRGRLDPGMKLQGVSIFFKPTAAQQSALEKLLRDQQDPSSPQYHHWLSPEEYADRFGLSHGDIDKVSAWLQGQGFTVTEVARGRNHLRFTGTVQQIEVAFRTELHRYEMNGEMHFANSTDLSVPKALVNVVSGFHNLDDFRPKPRARVRRLSSSPVASHFTSSVSGNHFVAPDDFATIYDLHSLYAAGFDGSGQTIAVTGQTAIDLSDVDAFRSASGLSALEPQLLLVPGTGNPAVFSSDLAEADLDVEWSGAVAKNAAIIYVYVGDDQNFGVFDSLSYAVDNNIAPVISISYGNCEANLGTFLDSLNATAQQANLQGQTITAASGDTGAADCDFGVASATQGLAVDAPASMPNVIAIGGSEFTGDPATTVPPVDTTYWFAGNNGSNGSAKSYIPETTWNDDTAICLVQSSNNPNPSFCATGGGASTYPLGHPVKPSWQTGTGVPNDGKRDLPDVSLNASPNHDGYLFCTSGSCVSGYRDASGGLAVVGGTSAGAPTFAGIFAILNQATRLNGQGDAHLVLYPLAQTHPTAFHDITSGNNIVPCTQGSTGCPTKAPFQIGFSATKGYDQVTGLGTIDGNVLVSSWPGYVSTPRTATTMTLTSAPAGSNLTFTAALNPATGPTGNVEFLVDGVSAATPAIANGVATFTSTTAGTGSHSVVALYAGDSTFAPSTSNGISIGYKFSAPSPSSVTVAIGKTVTSTITAVGSGGFGGAVSLACTPPGSVEITCAMSPASVNLSSTTASATSTLTVSTTAPHAISGAGARLSPHTAFGWLALSGTLLAGGFFFAAPGKRRRSLIGIALLIFVAVAMGVSCGGGSSSSSSHTDPGTPAGSYAVTVTGTNGSNTQTATVTVTVQ
ncbi:MAG TPA: protease pro-enzyme activation domain-containing protein [Terriglobales bacterium]|nr:protease pro-enzyme activation domain-containing protein [Terriglobales bacterium]